MVRYHPTALAVGSSAHKIVEPKKESSLNMIDTGECFIISNTILYRQGGNETDRIVICAALNAAKATTPPCKHKWVRGFNQRTGKRGMVCLKCQEGRLDRYSKHN